MAPLCSNNLWKSFIVLKFMTHMAQLLGTVFHCFLISFFSVCFMYSLYCNLFMVQCSVSFKNRVVKNYHYRMENVYFFGAQDIGPLIMLCEIDGYICIPSKIWPKMLADIHCRYPITPLSVWIFCPMYENCCKLLKSVVCLSLKTFIYLCYL